MDTNRKWFLLTYGTQLMIVDPLCKYLGSLAYTTSEYKVLPEEYYVLVDVGEGVEGTKTIIWQVSDKVKSGQLSIYIFIEYYIKYWRKTKESTPSSSHSGQIFGPCKASPLSNKLAKIHTIMTQICFQSVHTFIWWIKGLTVTILNIAGVIRTQNLRDILLFESGFNFENKLYFLSSWMKRAESSGVLPK